MTDPLPFALVVIETSTVGQLKGVRSVREAAEALAGDWPREGRGSLYRAAVRSCRAALEGNATAVSARNAFIRAAVEARIIVRTIELK